MNLHLLATFEAIFIIMLIVITWRQDSIKLFKCSRDRSKIVRDVIYKKFIPIFTRHETNLSYECPFHPDREFLWWPMYGHYDDDNDDDDDNEVDNHHSRWTCPICGIDFQCSKRLIFHWDTEHRYSRPYREDFVCLADYCEIFRCDIILKRTLQNRKRFLNYLSFEKNSDIKIGQCDSANMAILQEMCLNVIQQCMISIENNISTSQTLRSLRKELSDSFCSYLTCEHYHDDLFTDDDGTISRKVPIILFTIVGFIMFIGFILVYYFIWNVFNRNIVNNNDNETKKTLDKLDQQNYDNNTSFALKTKKENSKKSLKQTNINNYNHLHNKKQSMSSSSSNKFFENIFEFNQEKYDDSFEFNDLEQNQVSKFKAKLHAINSIIEEEEEESEFDISVHSYPNINRKIFRRNQRKIKLPMKEKDAKHSSQEICFQELPMKFHPKYVQPIKQLYSDQYPCNNDSMSDSFAKLSNKSRSFSHTHLRNVHNNNLSSRMFSKNPRRQYSVDEVEWEQPLPPRNYQQSHSNPLLQQLSHSNAQPIYSNKQINPISSSSLPLTSRYKFSECNGPSRHRPISKSAMSYHMMHPAKRRELYAASKTNSDASIGSCSSRCSNPTFFKN
ncbi:uncharacterized protein LOC113797330 [Dermatophagoides pteronyssinus]|uniref:uncharacterized protein LOC113797330 n=1 Tax=Dermatophagoides pteronyssinus TaxID=6956 RepID=UPI003F66A0EB